MTCTFNPLEYQLLLRPPRWLPSSGVADGRLPLAFLVVAASRPAHVVDIGVGDGEIYAALCQAINELGLPARALGIELAAAVQFKAYHAAQYAGFSRLVSGPAATFADLFGPGEIDLLHIGAEPDADETDAIYDAWRDRLSTRALVLVSDINPVVGRRDHGHFWSRLKARHPHFELTQGRGMGLVAVGPEPPAALAPLFASSADRQQLLRELLFRLGQAASWPQAAPAEISALEGALADRDASLHAAEEDRARLAQTLRDQTELADTLRARLDLVAAREREMRALYLDLHRQLIVRDATTIAGQNGHHAAPDESVTHLRIQLAAAQTHIQTIEAGRLWRMATAYWRARQRLRGLLRAQHGR
jgi:hypothetical protein